MSIDKKTVEKVLEISREDKITEKEACFKLGVLYSSLYAAKKRFGLISYGRGQNPNCNKKRVYNINDNFFEIPNIINSYWAGFIAADGNISKDKILSIGLAKKDKNILERFLIDSESNYKIGEYKHKKLFDSVTLRVISKKICDDLYTNFNITAIKSLTLIPPKLFDETLIDSFIIGYIDGDGTIIQQQNKRQVSLHISLIGTREICEWINKRFLNIINKELKFLYKDKKFKNNTWVLRSADRSARTLFQHFYSINVSKLERKWKPEFYNYCITYRKYRKIERYVEIYNLNNDGLSQSEIAKKLEISQAAISWFMKQDLYKNLKQNNNIYV